MAKAARPFAHFQLVGPRYFDAVGIRFAGGRAFDNRDTSVSAKVCIINEEFARRYLGDRDPLGASIDTLGETRQVVGVIRQVKVDGPADQGTLEIYVPYTQSESEGMALAVRTSGDPLAMIKPVVAAIRREMANAAAEPHTTPTAIKAIPSRKTRPRTID